MIPLVFNTEVLEAQKGRMRVKILIATHAPDAMFFQAIAVVMVVVHDSRVLSSTLTPFTGLPPPPDP